MSYHDTHFHLDLMKEPEKKVEEIERNGVYTIAVTNSPSVFFYTKELCAGKRYIRPALGFHPELVANRIGELNQFLSLLPQTRYIGEIGLDNSQKSKADFQKQLTVFKDIIKACKRFEGKILTIHSRKAEAEVMEIIGSNFPGKVILHWYSGSTQKIRKAISNGYYFSVNHKMLTSKSGRLIIEQVPVERILLESDAPFTIKSNQQYDQRIFEIMLAKLAKLKNISINQTHHILATNFKELLKP